MGDECEEYHRNDDEDETTKETEESDSNGKRTTITTTTTIVANTLIFNSKGYVNVLWTNDRIPCGTRSSKEIQQTTISL